ncbi:hypothetical protein HQ39_07765 [Porphyromonas sp. COT-108 OH2963]|nr:hypothetical protein HQ39_07765 [Porphyromonas sp. COT-108 OH2963]
MLKYLISCDFLLLLFFWSPTWVKDKEKKPRKDFLCVAVCLFVFLYWEHLYRLCKIALNKWQKLRASSSVRK